MKCTWRWHTSSMPTHRTVQDLIGQSMEYGGGSLRSHSLTWEAWTPTPHQTRSCPPLPATGGMSMKSGSLRAVRCIEFNILPLLLSFHLLHNGRHCCWSNEFLQMLDFYACSEVELPIPPSSSTLSWLWCCLFSQSSVLPFRQSEAPDPVEVMPLGHQLLSTSSQLTLNSPVICNCSLSHRYSFLFNFYIILFLF